MKSATIGTLTTSNTFDADGNVVGTTDSGTKDGQALAASTSSVFDALGRITRYTDELNRSTNYGYTASADGYTATTTYTDGTSEEDKYYLDGALASVSGNAAATPATFDEDVDPTTGDFMSISYGPESNQTNRSTTYINPLGQAYKTTQSTPSGGVATATTDYFTDAADSYFIGMPKRTTDFDGTVTLFGYDQATGLPNSTTIDVNQDGQSDSGDRRTTVAYSGADTPSDEWAGTTVTVHGSSGDTVEFSGTKNGGLDTEQIDNGLVTTTHVDLDPAVTVTAPDGTQVKDDYLDGLLQSEERLSASGSVIASQTFDYDGLRRNDKVTDPAFGPTTFT